MNKVVPIINSIGAGLFAQHRPARYQHPSNRNNGGCWGPRYRRRY